MAKWVHKLCKLLDEKQIQDEIFPLIMDMIEHEESAVVAQGLHSFRKTFKKVSEGYLMEHQISLKVLSKSYEN